jgi:DNA-binding response OmpR family regulator
VADDVCREIKRQAPAVPVIVLSAKTDVTDKVLLLEIGADDYVTKPFSPRELLARVRAAMRRTSRRDPGDVFSFGEVYVDFAKMEIARKGQPVLMTAQEFKLLKFLVQNSGRHCAAGAVEQSVGLPELSFYTDCGQPYLEAPA